MKKLLAIFFFIFIVTITTHAYAQSYLCITETKIGFESRANWKATTFDIKDHKYFDSDGKFIVKPSTGKGGTFDHKSLFKYSIFEFGDKPYAIAGCEENAWNNDPSDDELKYYYVCEGDGVFHINLEKMRFTRFDVGGYIFKDVRFDTTMEIGTCSKI